MADILLLGPVLFEDFELPEHIRFGGSQLLAVHRLPGGTRVIDATGRDDAPIVWEGAFSGQHAVERARLLDLLRGSGDALPLIWDSFYYTVLIANFTAEYSRSNWIPYRIACTVLRDECAAAAQVVISATEAVLADLTSAEDFACGIDLSGAIAAAGTDGAGTRGTDGYAAATGMLRSTSASVDSQIANAEAAIVSAADLGEATSAAHTLASTVAARGYILRAQANLADAGT